MQIRAPAETAQGRRQKLFGPFSRKRTTSFLACNTPNQEASLSATTYPDSAPAIPGIARYTRLAMVFHWLVALGIAVNFLIVWTIDSLPEAAERPLINLHKSIGLTVLGLAIMRVLWRYANPPPPMPAGYKTWERMLAHAAHYSLYALIFLMPLTGWIHDSAWKAAAANPLRLYGIIPWFRLGFITDKDPATKQRIHDIFSEIHGVLGWVLLALVALHVAGALKHQIFDKKQELQRMFPG